MKSAGILEKEFQKKLPGKIMMYVSPNEHQQRQLFWYGYYEKPVGITIKRLLKPGHVFLDIGANIGYFSLLAAKCCPSSMVVSFEPVIEIFEKLQKNILLNNTPNIITVNMAAGEKDEVRDIYLSAPDNTGMSSLEKPENYSGVSQKTEVIAIDTWFARSNLPKVDLVKIDVEGNELSVLKGMKTVIEKFRPLIIMEVNPETLSLFRLSVTDLYRQILNLGYEAHLIAEDGSTGITDVRNIIEQVNVLFVPAAKS